MIRKTDNEPVISEKEIPAPKRRGRPRKNPIEVEVAPDRLGILLQQARHQRHMKLPSIAKKLCIKECYLDALEKGHYYAFPALVYGAGFLRSYATFLGLNANEMAERFRRETTDIKVNPVDMPRATDPTVLPDGKVILKAVVILLTLYVGWIIFKAMMHQPMPEPEMPVVEEAISQVTPSEEIQPVVADDLQRHPEAIKKEEEKKAAVQLPVVQEVAKIVPVEEVKPAPLPKPRVGTVYGLKTPVRVSFVATDKVQVEIRDTEADSVLFQKTLEAGDQYNPIAEPEGMVLKTTNAGGLDVYVDGKKVQTLGKKGQMKAGVQMNAEAFLKDKQ